jgi:hypothetical protein
MPTVVAMENKARNPEKTAKISSRVIVLINRNEVAPSKEAGIAGPILTTNSGENDVTFIIA